MERTSEVQGNTRELRSFFEAHNDAIVQSEDRGALERFAGTLKIGHIVAVVVANEMWETEEYTDDDFWLAIVMSEPRTLDSKPAVRWELAVEGGPGFRLQVAVQDRKHWSWRRREGIHLQDQGRQNNTRRCDGAAAPSSL